ncbi:MAG: hypothetical protein IKZ09_12500 [Clostridia bacterium]|nr:hypothetical protein [Clostridia bacterium]
MNAVVPSRSYFAAANTADGFYSHFPVLFDPRCGRWQKIYIIKGGPGTGKSALMKRAAEAAEQKGFAVERYYCSSDTRSLDGIRIPACGIAMLDGTAPHTVDAMYPGAVEELINMGMFFDTRALREHASDIRALCEEHAACHARARRYLRAAGAVRENKLALSKDAFLSQKAADAAWRIVKELPKEREPMTEMQFVTAISVQGIVHLPTLQGLGTCSDVTEGAGAGASLFFDALVDAAERRGVSFVRFASPLRPAETEGICFPTVGLVYQTDRDGKAADIGADAPRAVNTARFLDREALARHRGALRFAGQCENMLMQGACDALAEAGRVHDALEAYYIAAMDFDALNTYTAHFLNGGFLRGFC